MHPNRTDISEGIDLAKGSNSKKFMICHFWFLNHGFDFQDFIFTGWFDNGKC